jgi:uncharacterized protein YndB with AHSA1/START domain
MKNSLLFDFTVDKTTNTVFVKKQFEAALPLVWDAFTKKEILDQWWAPKPWLSKTKYMRFEVGGRRFYAMVGPQGEEHWSVQDFTSIRPKTNFKYDSAFADKDEKINPEMPSSNWNLDFAEADGVTTVNISIKQKSLAGLEQMIQMGFKEGFTMTLTYLDTLLSNESAH